MDPLADGTDSDDEDGVCHSTPSPPLLASKHHWPPAATNPTFGPSSAQSGFRREVCFAWDFFVQNTSCLIHGFVLMVCVQGSCSSPVVALVYCPFGSASGWTSGWRMGRVQCLLQCESGRPPPLASPLSWPGSGGGGLSGSLHPCGCSFRRPEYSLLSV